MDAFRRGANRDPLQSNHFQDFQEGKPETSKPEIYINAKTTGMEGETYFNAKTTGMKPETYNYINAKTKGMKRRVLVRLEKRVNIAIANEKRFNKHRILWQQYGQFGYHDMTEDR